MLVFLSVLFLYLNNYLFSNDFDEVSARILLFNSQKLNSWNLDHSFANFFILLQLYWAF